jgi:hypothetical protein
MSRLGEKEQHPAVARNILRIFQETGVPEKYEGALIDICFGHLVNEGSPVAIRAFAITNASNICRKYPELKKELAIMLSQISQIPQTPAIRQRINLALKEMGRVDSNH